VEFALLLPLVLLMLFGIIDFGRALNAQITITQAAREGDPAALRCFEIVGSWLGQGLADLAAILDPGCFVIGGGVSEAGDLLLSPARAAFEASLTGKYYRPFAEIRLAELGENAGLVGAADLARRG
jgi:glucokinase